MTRQVVIVPTGVANIASVQAAWARIGAEPVVSDDPVRVRDAAYAMLPGVGAFGPAMAALQSKGLDEALRRRVEADRPTICICVGHQLLFESSEESPDVAGLCIVEAHIGRFSDEVRVPQFGWNHVEAQSGCTLLQDGYAYFANSYRALAAPGCSVALADHDGLFVAGLEMGNLLACQFHPELSGAYGRALMTRFLER
ncbi:MAG TPA: imidazole glycerol phosphate synthase subunit HisH [Geminicoccus sp.]|jgi:imidazole glycerol phosphate synthase glutamine amidotransferase subunit|uniref:imidazole glycerol phosphate synthase subunit HisH n=1 Tax=Geminicoccus sp. TaxID=2024832 RepID=UPI002E3412DF|nr:imidazole glycerol phosphate synthase subunit HisH [Geminicoccus sp.]HEX2525093.1 imidazole glycerol phosphate synthase subunit HisH [Geminicoccus sp.]